MTPGQSLVYRFCDDVGKGKTPCKDDMAALAEALQPIAASAHCKDTVEIMDAVAKNLGLVKKQGKKLAEDRKWFESASIVACYLLMVEQLLEAGKPQKEAEQEARSFYMGKLNIGDRAMRDRINNHKDAAIAMLPILRWGNPAA